MRAAAGWQMDGKSHSGNERGQAGIERWVQGDNQTVRRVRYHLSWEERTRADMDRNRKGKIRRASLQRPRKSRQSCQSKQAAGMQRRGANIGTCGSERGWGLMVQWCASQSHDCSGWRGPVEDGVVGEWGYGGRLGTKKANRRQAGRQDASAAPARAGGWLGRNSRGSRMRQLNGTQPRITGQPGRDCRQQRVDCCSYQPIRSMRAGDRGAPLQHAVQR